MTPGHVAADHHGKVGLLQIIVAARNHILAEGPNVAGNRGSHA